MRGTIAEAVAAIADNEAPAVLAGGTDLPARFNEGFCPSTLVDISRIEELQKVTLTNGTIRIGAAVTHAAGCAHPLVREKLPSFARAWSRIANVRIRFSATLGGNLMALRTRYEGSILLSALGARVRLQSSSGELECAVNDLWTLTQPKHALLTVIEIPLRKGLRLDYERDLRPIMTQAVAVDDDGPGQVVTATEHVIPNVRTLSNPMDANSVQGEIEFNDPVTRTSYIRQVSPTLLGRQLDRIRNQ